MRSLLIAAACAAGLLVTPALAQPRAADAILILDASGSMWGQVEGQTKIVAARKAVDTILARWKPGDRLGLMAYGHRSKGECRDIELIVPVGPVDAVAIKGALQRLNPRGKTPIAASLREAAGILKHTENQATVILVSDGVETCDPNPCAIAADLKKASIGFTAHVVGFDVTDPVAKAQLQCIARATGGVYLDAGNAAGLDSAMTRVAQAAQGQKIASEAPAAAPRARDPFEGRNLRATARLAEGSDPLTDRRISWQLREINAEKAPGDIVIVEYGARLAVKAPTGAFFITVGLGETSRSVPVTIEPGKTLTLDLVLDAAVVTSTGAVEGSGARAEGVTWAVERKDGETVTTVYDAVPGFVLPAGDYVLKLSKGSAAATKAFRVEAGDSIDLAMSLAVGRLAVDALYAAAGPKVEEGLSVEFRHPPKAVGEDGEWVMTLYDPLSIANLAAGPYDMIIGTGDAKKTIRIEIASGQDRRLTVDLNAGVVALTATSGQRIEIGETRKSITGTRKILVTNDDGAFQTALPAGDYLAILSQDGKIVSETPLRVAAGERVELTLK
ncbi:MAG: VWA domain-containing protein [Beijerinckiaceae bacterium]|nr:VWA domain-containing protein [Beijerinckiaceae bacterium]